MGKADGLSRQPDWKVGVEKNNDNQVFIKDNWICKLEEVVIRQECGQTLGRVRVRTVGNY